MPAEVKVELGPEWARVSKAFQRAAGDKSLLHSVRGEVRQVADAHAAVARKAVKGAAPSSRTSGHKAKERLGNRIARAVAVSVKLTGRTQMVALRVMAKKMPGGQGNLPGYTTGAGRWRHPVYGRDVWVSQPGWGDWWGPVAARFGRAASSAVGAGIDRVAKRLDRMS